MKFKTYDEFVEKFKPKLTTDDCYTPPVVYEAVADWAANENMSLINPASCVRSIPTEIMKILTIAGK